MFDFGLFLIFIPILGIFGAILYDRNFYNHRARRCLNSAGIDAFLVISAKAARVKMYLALSAMVFIVVFGVLNHYVI